MGRSEGGPIALALVHYPVRDRLGEIRATSVTPLNIHDLARSATTYGLSHLYIVTPIISQQELTGRVLRHWREGHGGVQNPSRKESLEIVTVVSSVNEAADDLFGTHEAYPHIVGTGAGGREGTLGYGEMAEKMGQSRRPWLILFGTGWGLTPDIMDQCDFFLAPVRGRGEFNHLSVRSAVAIVLDRLFGT